MDLKVKSKLNFLDIYLTNKFKKYILELNPS